MRNMSMFLLPVVILLGCASQGRKSATSVLSASTGTNPSVAAELDKSHALHASSDRAGVERAFRQTINSD